MSLTQPHFPETAKEESKRIGAYFSADPREQAFQRFDLLHAQFWDAVNDKLPQIAEECRKLLCHLAAQNPEVHTQWVKSKLQRFEEANTLNIDGTQYRQVRLGEFIVEEM